MEGYYCKECGRAVIVRKGEIIRACKCKGPVIASMSATATGDGKVVQSVPKQAS